MDISATADQGNSMLSEMKEHNLGISHHNDDLLLVLNHHSQLECDQIKKKQ